MKPTLQYVFLFFLLIFSLSWYSSCFAQKDKYSSRQVTIVYPDSTVKTYILNQRLSMKTRENIEYYWVYNQKMYKNKGDYAYYLIHGPYLVFDSNDRLITKGEFELGAKEGKWKRWFSDGKLKAEINWKHGEKHGTCRIYNETGALQSKLRYRDDQLNGKCEYYTEGEVVIKRYKNGKEVELKSIMDYLNSIKPDQDTISDQS